MVSSRVFFLPSHGVCCDRDHNPILDTDLRKLSLCVLTRNDMVWCLGNPMWLSWKLWRCPQGELGSSGPCAVFFTSLSLCHILPMYLGLASKAEVVQEEKSLLSRNYSQSLKLWIPEVPEFSDQSQWHNRQIWDNSPQTHGSAQSWVSLQIAPVQWGGWGRGVHLCITQTTL